MSPHKRVLLKVFGFLFGIPLILLIVVHRLVGPFTYTSDPIRARLVDEQTGKPVAGAVIVASWMQEGINEIPLHRVETVSDSAGWFVVPAMPRKFRMPLTTLHWRDPWMVIYKPGYGGRILHNHDAYIQAYGAGPIELWPTTTVMPDGRFLTSGGGYSNTSKRYSYWNGKTIPLVPSERPEDEAKIFSSIRGEINSFDYPPRKFPLIWRALVEGYDRLSPEHAKNEADPRKTINYWSSR